MTVTRMYWDSGFDSWAAYGVSGQPAAVLIDAKGVPRGAWIGPLDTKKVEAALARL